ncbi:MAG: bifunctional phosphoglucose/phosphomannose isomerase [Thermoplasmata archaeon]|nr:MAG: bifunctional phosphoglucose/phosphomannose isomerase [Thermoplasmata archaeon]RLF57369.1 MAG: bifunctional phosphoglucose/phosphomannose isomerase [Thermoplasmata archaeon]
MLKIVERFPEQIEDALKIPAHFDFGEVSNVVVAAMGGSAIPADILSHFSQVPFSLVQDYHLPASLDKNTLFIAISYSGNTEETLSCFKKARGKCKTLAVTSGGALASLAEHAIIIPGGMQPRAAIAYLLFPLARILSDAGILTGIDLDEALYMARSTRTRFGELARDVAAEIHGVPIVYGHGIMASIARRWRQQLNENAKMPAFDFAVPECNHNEIEAWEGDVGAVTCIFLRERNERQQIQRRFSFMKKIYGEKARIIEVFSEGENAFARAVSLLYLGDMVSVHRARLNGVDAEPVNLIAQLKDELSQHSRSSS